MRITALTSPLVDPSGPTAVSARALHGVDEFVAALGEAAGIVVSVHEGSIDDAPADGFILVFGDDGRRHLHRRPELGPRTVLLAADRAVGIYDVESFDLAAAVLDVRYNLWCQQRADDGPERRGVLVRRDVSERIAAAPQTHGPESAHYAFFCHPAHPTLIQFLAYYLRNLDAISCAIRV